MIGIIGGTGVYDENMFENIEPINEKTSYGKHSDIIKATLDGKEVVMCFRHNKDHSLPPHKINFKANIQAMKNLGVKEIISICATGSLKEKYKPGDVVLPDQFIDFGKPTTFYDGPDVYHLSLAKPFCEKLRTKLKDTCKKYNIHCKDKGTYIRINGPRFSTKAESKMYKEFADIIGMTGVPEAVLAREKEMSLAILSTITDYDVWKDEPVSASQVQETMKSNIKNVKKIIEDIIKNIEEEDCQCKHSLKDAKI